VKNGNFMIFNRVFSRNTLNGFINNDYPTQYITAIRRSFINPKNKTNKTIISEIYKYMTENYRNEYIYKNTLLNKLLVDSDKHSVENTTVLTEIPVGNSKADFIMINGNIEVYEIKTELDNFSKLETQIYDYYKAFNRINIIISDDKLDILKKYLSNSKIGIHVLDKNMNLYEIREAKSENKYLDHKTIFRILRKKEYENILVKKIGKLPDVSQFDYYEECLKTFAKIDIKKIYLCFRDELKKRCSIEKTAFLSLSNPVNSLAYFSNIKTTEIERLSFFLNSIYDEGRNVLSIS
jgi:hypothetical protein